MSSSGKKKGNIYPLILAPAGDRLSFLAALAAGADAVYCGLKQFSARMKADNFTEEELCPLVKLAHKKNTDVYIALNTLVKPDELDDVGGMIDRLNRHVHPDALIIQDLAMVQLARQVGYRGELHLSTLANVSFPSALKAVKKHSNISRVVVPRELSIDEIKDMARACPPGVTLEAFVHGALCYGVSGRCYWSSYLGGKSSLRGRCVQPCRRLYRQNRQKKRFFSCQDLSLDVLAKTLHNIPEIRAWKIEGRKKGPHYVFHTVRAYKILRDKSGDPKMKKEALAILDQALGRSGTHYNYLPQRPQFPVNTKIETGSGLLAGKVQGSSKRPYMVPRLELMTGDILRVGYEGGGGHSIFKVTKFVPKRGRLYLKPFSGKSSGKGISVFLIDRREKELEALLSELEKELEGCTGKKGRSPVFKARVTKKKKRRIAPVEMRVYRWSGRVNNGEQSGYWLSPDRNDILKKKGIAPGVWWWLQPVIWPEEEKKIKGLINGLLKKGCRDYVLNAPWQISFFKDVKKLNLWAGPFCNQSNPLSINMLASWGFKGVIVSPEMGRKDLLGLPGRSSLPLGAVISGCWPLSISRTISEGFKMDTVFASPRGENAWVKKYGTGFWAYPNWKLDLSSKKRELRKAGYRMFVHLDERIPEKIKIKKRQGLWNWEQGLL